MRTDIKPSGLILHISVLVLVALTTGQGSIAAEPQNSVQLRKLKLPNVHLNYEEHDRPAYLKAAGHATFDTTPASNQLTNSGATLGRVLFYDTQLSANYTISCGSCHVQKHAFTDPRSVSVGFNGQKMDRNSMSLVDLRYVRAGFFWDERAETLEQAVLQPLFSHVEMGLDPDTLIRRIDQDPRYRPLFRDAFGTEQATVEHVANALSQFIRSMESYRSKYDTAVAEVDSSRERFPGFTESENLGKQLFFDRCVACHHLGTEAQVANFAMFRSLNNGIDIDGTVRDGGRGDITFDPSEVGSFKASTLRNVEYTAPYMHDGRLATLEDVIEHYSTGVNRHPNLGPVSRFQFSDAEKKALVDFLKTLSDPHFINNIKFSDPWDAETVHATPSLSTETPNEPSPNPKLVNSSEVPSSGSVHGDSQTWQAVLGHGKGIPASATLPWLRHLDKNNDGKLSHDEVGPVERILLRTGGVASRSRTRAAAALVGRDIPDGGPPRGDAGRRRTGEPASSERPADRRHLLDIGDLDGDGKVSEQDMATYQALTRYIELAGGGRLEVFLDRLLGRFNFTEEQQQLARTQLRSARVSLIEDGRDKDLDLCQKLAIILGSDGYQAFQSRVVDRLAEARTSAPGSPISREQVEQLIWSHDSDDDQTLDTNEIEGLARTLASSPGGFGQVQPAGVDIRLFGARILRFDENGDGVLSPSELPERMRRFAVEGDLNRDGKLDARELEHHLQLEAYDRLVLTGIYVGGGFANTLIGSRQALDEIELPSESRQQASELIKAREAQLKSQIEETLKAQAKLLQKLSQQPVTRNASSPGVPINSSPSSGSAKER